MNVSPTAASDQKTGLTTALPEQECCPVVRKDDDGRRRVMMHAARTTSSPSGTGRILTYFPISLMRGSTSASKMSEMSVPMTVRTPSIKIMNPAV